VVVGKQQPEKEEEEQEGDLDVIMSCLGQEEGEEQDSMQSSRWAGMGEGQLRSQLLLLSAPTLAG
jgi:hypothetical protein